MKKLFLVWIALMMMASLLVTSVSAAPATLLTPTPEMGQLKVCKVAGSGVQQGRMFAFRVNGTTYNVPAGPADRGYCVLAGTFPLDTHVTIQEVIPAGYYVSRIEVKPDRTVSKNTSQGVVTVRIISGVVEAIFTNKVAGTQTPTRTPTSVNTATPRPTRTPTSTPSCAPNCTPTSTPIPTGRMQICKEAEDPGVTGIFTFRFEGTRSRQAPVGACAGLTSVNAGILTINEVLQTGYLVSEIYTIPADRLISKDLNAGSARIRIVEGEAASQTIVIFRNRSVTNGSFTPTRTPTVSWTPSTATSTATPTSTGSVTATFTSTPTATPTSTGSITATFTSTPTATPTLTNTPTPTGTLTCPQVRITANFSKVGVGESVEGMNTVADYLDIQAKGLAVRVAQQQEPQVLLAPNGSPPSDPDPGPNYVRVRNGGLVAYGGFSDLETQSLGQAHEYTFTFARPVSNFSLHMLDFGDLNADAVLRHEVTMVGYDAVVNGQPIPGASQALTYETPPGAWDPHYPRESDKYGDLWFSGDAVSASNGQPGNWTWKISGAGIRQVVLSFPEGHDPNIAFDLLSFTIAGDCQCQPFNTADFSQLAVNDSVEGLGKVHPDLSIDAKGLAKKVAQAELPQMYLASNGIKPPLEGLRGARNGGLSGQEGGFSDVQTQSLGQAHEYTFTFAKPVSNFSLLMLDYGDLNPQDAQDHVVTMVGYDAVVNGQPIPGASQQLRYTIPDLGSPYISNKYGDLWFSGDGISAELGEPGNWVWNISGTGIRRIVLSFPEGHDPNIGFGRLSFIEECP
jgi:hypothetical protein